jgi:hypothetical protein
MWKLLLLSAVLYGLSWLLRKPDRLEESLRDYDRQTRKGSDV